MKLIKLKVKKIEFDLNLTQSFYNALEYKKK